MSIISKYLYSVVLLLFALVLVVFSSLQSVQPVYALSLSDIQEKAKEAAETAGSMAVSAGQSGFSKVADVDWNAALDSSYTKAVEVGKLSADAAIRSSIQAKDAALQLEKATINAATVTTEKLNEKLVTVSQVVNEDFVNLLAAAQQGKDEAIDLVSQGIADQYQERVVPLLADIIKNIDLTALEAEFRQIKQEHPEFDPKALANYFVATKMQRSSVMSDWHSTVTSLVEMVYQIAQSHGLDIYDKARQDETMQIAAAGLGSTQVCRGSVLLVQYAAGQIPLIGDLGAEQLVGLGTDRLTTLFMFKALGTYASRQYDQVKV